MQLKATPVSRLMLVTLLITLTALLCGRFGMSATDSLSTLVRLPEVLWCLISTQPLPDDLSPEQQVILLVRLPRLLMALLVGAGLAMAGTLYQGVFRNPLVSPDILGVTSGCMFGAALGLLLPYSSWIAVQILAFGFGLAAAGVAITMARKVGNNSLLIMIMTGIIVGSLFSAALMIVKILADPYGQLPAIIFWLMGSLSTSSWASVAKLLPALLVGYGIAHLLRYQLNVLCLGDKHSRSLGLSPERLRLVLTVISSFVVAACVSVVGQVAWIGLVVPHMVRTLTGADHLKLLPLSTVTGACFMVIADAIARSSFSMELPVGIVTSVIGAPLFAYLLYRSSWHRGHHA
ncbi:iron ABC transporter permease [Ferrimonas sp. SCSIO 43195]|uniref:FecCD family ABC transporter permease n=1 Tax=Ferrimonas sp. SCSIO 43195 TaxID=2822844 RepID=UPI002076231B|nr:iron ABC transporter permease [Ferrimonas sp. SCSIO 43195]USD39469.1 iron ABC transporter permease [Ferrimonas sp. SCSIO 43195]